MPVISLVNQKGGSSKSTTAIHLARFLQLEGKDVSVLDADVQGSAEIWSQYLDIPCVKEPDPEKLIDKVDELGEWVVIDSPGKLAETTRAILLVSDIALIPVSPTGLDLNAAMAIVNPIRQARKIRSGPPEAFFFLARAQKGTRLLDEAKAALEEIKDIPLLNPIVYQRQAIADSFGQGVTAFDMKGTAAKLGARDYRNIFKEVL